MKKLFVTSLLAGLMAVGLPWFTADRPPRSGASGAEAAPMIRQAEPEEAETQLVTGVEEVNETPVAAPVIVPAEVPAPEVLTVLTEDGEILMDLQQYLVGVVAAEMPAGFESEALKAQAVAARTFALYSAAAHKHGSAQVCTDFGCCQAWHSDETLRQNWGESYEGNIEKIRAAVLETAGQYLSYEGQAVFAAFHSSSAGATEDCGRVWNPRPYLVSVSSPETPEDVPNYISSVSCAAIDFRDTVLYAHPEADFTGAVESWIGEIRRDESGRVDEAVLGGIAIRGTELRSLFKLRSTAFELRCEGGVFTFTVTGFGHGVGMSQYGANVMARQGADYAAILAHYYPGTLLTA